jgi:hypothetical protein
MLQKYLKWFIHDNLCFSQMSQASPLKESFAYSLVSLYFPFKAGKSSWVYSRTQGFVPIVVADSQMYYGYCINCLYPAMGDN